MGATSAHLSETAHRLPQLLREPAPIRRRQSAGEKPDISLIERAIDFNRDRHMLCGACGRRWTVDLEWIERWDQGFETCPGCGVDCTKETSPRVTVDSDDPALDDADVPRLAWYHTSTHADWPRRDIDPAAGLTRETKQRMGGDAHVAAWAERQRGKALHVGTYEAAIHNMMRRLDDQGDDGKQFYLYRVHLRPDAVVRPGWLIDPSNFVGDVELTDVCPPGTDVARYLNYHEDPGGLSLALGRGAIAVTQRLPIPSRTYLDEVWVSATAADIREATAVPPRPAWMRSTRVTVTPQAHRAGQIADGLAERLPVNLRDQFRSALGYRHHSDPRGWARYGLGLVATITDPDRVVANLTAQPVRSI